MNERTGNSLPRIAILIATYEPRMNWLREQLESLNAQTYPNLMLYVRDDCSLKLPFEELEALVGECITAFPYEIRRNERNLGSNGTFELLTREAEGEYFAYCDQDDVWLPEKLTILQETLEREHAQLVCSDMFIIDGDGKRVANSITKIRRHHRFKSGEGIAKELLVSNFVTGCAMLIRAKTAKEAMPFCPDMVHDHYLALYAASKGKLISLPRQTIYYRVHMSNQTLAMAGVRDKASYLEVRIRGLIHRLEWLEKAFAQDPELRGEIRAALAWAKAREANFLGDGRARRLLWKNRRFSPMTALFELTMARAPKPIFMFCVNLKRRNIV